MSNISSRWVRFLLIPLGALIIAVAATGAALAQEIDLNPSKAKRQRSAASSSNNLNASAEIEFSRGATLTFMYTTLGVILLIIILVSIKQVNQWQRGVKFTLGKYRSTLNPGWRLVIPIFQRLVKVDMRLKAVDVPAQLAITKDNVSAKINAVIYYKIMDAAKAIIDVQNVDFAVMQLAQTTMRNVAGEVTLDELLAERQAVADRIEGIVDKATDGWGVDVTTVELKDIDLPDDMVRTMAKQAEAERERRAVIINAEGEVIAATNLAKAADILASKPGALHLRTLNSINDISSDASNTVVFVTPIEILHAIEGFAKKMGH